MAFKGLKILCYTVISIILSYYIAILLHEYAHATMAWIFGYKPSPFDITYGSWYLIPVSESVDYASILAAGHGTREALIGISGISMTFLLFLISLYCLQQKSIQKNAFILSLFFWLTDINLMEMFSYINRTFVIGDIGEFVQGLKISPLWIFIPGSFILGLAIYRFFGYEIIKMYKLLPIKTILMQRIFLWITFCTLPLTIIYWEAPTSWKVFSNITNSISLLIVIAIIFSCDPSRKWVRKLLCFQS